MHKNYKAEFIKGYTRLYEKPKFNLLQTLLSGKTKEEKSAFESMAQEIFPDQKSRWDIWDMVLEFQTLIFDAKVEILHYLVENPNKKESCLKRIEWLNNFSKIADQMDKFTMETHYWRAAYRQSKVDYLKLHDEFMEVCSKYTELEKKLNDKTEKL